MRPWTKIIRAGVIKERGFSPLFFLFKLRDTSNWPNARLFLILCQEENKQAVSTEGVGPLFGCANFSHHISQYSFILLSPLLFPPPYSHCPGPHPLELSLLESPSLLLSLLCQKQKRRGPGEWHGPGHTPNLLPCLYHHLQMRRKLSRVWMKRFGLSYRQGCTMRK